MNQFTEQEIDTIRRGAMGAVALVSQAEPGFFATFKESMAASKALADAPEEFKKLMTGGMVMPPKASSKEEMATKLLDELRQAVQVAGKDAPTLEALRSYVSAASQEVAGAAKGVSDEERRVIEQVNGILGQTPGTQTPGTQTPGTEAAATDAPAAPAQQPAPQTGQVSEAPASGTPQAQPGGADDLKWPTA
ncbi:hypothetical protein ACTQ49_11130 [Luteococcus sp. Sow4_B9]|uniref:hypothetical protein n=1 Tax=Luteococcus sp. Sow4_B9 TaxID=3438792 RepID=UPI003F968AF9